VVMPYRRCQLVLEDDPLVGWAPCRAFDVLVVVVQKIRLELFANDIGAFLPVSRLRVDVPYSCNAFTSLDKLPGGIGESGHRPFVIPGFHGVDRESPAVDFALGSLLLERLDSAIVTDEEEVSRRTDGNSSDGAVESGFASLDVRESRDARTIVEEMVFDRGRTASRR
jgi:hypothetical protein